MSSSKCLTCELSFSLRINFAMNRLPNFFSESDSGPFLSVTHFTFCQREVILTRFEPYERRQVMPLGRWQRASGQQGLVPGRAVTPFQVYTLGKRSPCSWEQTLLSVGTTAPSLPGQCTCVALPALTLTVTLPHCSEVPGTGYFNVHVSIYQSIYADDFR